MIHRELFRRGEEFVATGYIRMTKDVMLSPGDNLDKKVFKLFHLRSLYARRLIGVKGSKWANQMILGSKHNLTKLKPEVADIKQAVSDKKKSDKEKNLVAIKLKVAVPPDVKAN